jgi:hypothetical protein
MKKLYNKLGFTVLSMIVLLILSILFLLIDDQKLMFATLSVFFVSLFGTIVNPDTKVIYNVNGFENWYNEKSDKFKFIMSVCWVISIFSALFYTPLSIKLSIIFITIYMSLFIIQSKIIETFYKENKETILSFLYKTFIIVLCIIINVLIWTI